MPDDMVPKRSNVKAANTATARDLIVGGVIVLLALFAVVAWGAAHSAKPKPAPTFHCNGTTGVYESRDGSQVVPQAYDPACSHYPTGSPDDGG